MKNTRSLKLNNIKYGNLQSHSSDKDNYIWACNDRENMLERFENFGDIDIDELKSVQSQLLALTVEVNKRPKLSIWQELNEHLNHISALSDIILIDKKLESELNTVYKYLLANPEFSYLLPGMEMKLRQFLGIRNKTLSKQVDRNKEEEGEHYPLPIRKCNKMLSSKIMPENVVEWFVDREKGDLFNPATIDRNITVKPKKIKMKDFLAAIGSVAKEIIFTQYAFEKPLENLIRAFDVDLSEFRSINTGEVDDRFSEIEECSLKIPESEDLSEDSKNVDLAKGFPKPKSGRDTIIYMIKCFHLREMRVAYLNYTKQRIRDLYSLTVVRKTQVEPEHYIFSSFGIIHRFPDGTGVAMSLTDWYRESILYCALKCMPFVKQFLVRKYFQGWRSLTVSNRHLSVGKYLSRNLMTVNVTYGKSILQIARLLDEISQIKFLPTELSEVQTEASFAQLISHSSSVANEYLIKFYKYVQMMVNETAAELYKALQFSQVQSHSNNLYSKDSIYTKKIKQKHRQQALTDCLDQVYKLGDFVKLVNFMLNSKIVEIALNNITILGELLCAMEINIGNEGPADNKPNKIAIFRTKAVIVPTDEKLMLKAFPGVEDIEAMFTNIINSIPKLILKHCYPLDGLIRSDHLNRFKDIIVGNLSENRTGHSTILTSKSEILTEIMSKSERRLDKITKPDLPYIKLPVKSEDNLRVATPPAVNPNIFDKPSLKLFGRSIPAKFTPINTEDVFEMLRLNPIYCNLIDGFTELFHECQQEMNALFQEVNWMVDVRNEYNLWAKVNMSTEWITQSPYFYEQKLVKVKRYIHNLENTEKQVILSNRIFTVSFEAIIEELLAEMEFELETISDFILNSVRKLGLEFIGKITDVLQFLRERTLEVEIFTKVVHYIGYSRDNHAEFQKSVDFIKSLFDVLRISAKHIKEKDKSIEDEVTSLWESFIFQLQEANDFVNSEKENVLFTIKTRIKELEDSARNIENVICGSRYSTVSDDVKEVLMEISKVLEGCDQIHGELDSLFKCYQSIAIEECPKTVDLDQIRSLVSLVYSNWTLLFNSADQIEIWKRSLFSLFQISTAAERISEWETETAAFKLNYNSRIMIVEQTRDGVNEFASFMPFFRQLSSQMFTLQHWQQFFLQIGHEFIDPYDKLTVQDLIDLDVREHSRILEALHNDAAMKNKANKEFNHHLRYWITKEFEFEEHRTDLRCQRSLHERFESIAISKTPVGNRTRSELERYHDNKSLENKLEKLSRLPITNNENREIFLIGELNKLEEDIADSIISIQLKKPQAKGDDRYKLLVRALEDLRLSTTILGECQEKWLFLERIFEEESFVQAHLETAANFVNVNKDILVLLDQIKQSPLVFHYSPIGKVLLSQKDSEDSNLKSRLLELIERMNGIICNIEEIMKNVRHHFPRLFFLPDYQLIELLNCKFSQNIQSINRFMPSIFPAVKRLLFDEATNAISLISQTGERLDLYKPVCPRNSASQWLKEFELVFKSTLKFYIESCLVQQSEESNEVTKEAKSAIFMTERTKSTMFQEIDTIDQLTHRMSESNKEKVEELVNSILLTFESWLMKYPLQVLLVADKIFFAKTLRKALTDPGHEIASFKLNLMLKKHNYVHLINKISKNENLEQLRMLSAIQNLVVLNDRHIEILAKLMEDPDCSSKSFVYQAIVKYDTGDNEANLLIPSNVHRFGNVTIQCCMSQFLYDYEYIAISRCDLFLTSVTEQVTVNMLLGLYSNEIPTIIGNFNSNKLEIAKSFSEVLGRNLFAISSGRSIYSESFRKYFLGALMSGSLLFVNNFDEISVGDISEMSKYLWKLRLLLQERSNLENKRGMIRRLSLPSRVGNERMVKVSFRDKDVHSLSERIIRSASQSGRCRTDYYEMQTNKLNKGNNWPFFTPEYEKSTEDDYDTYVPNYVTGMEIYDEIIDVRYGFGVCCGIMNDRFKLGSIPMSLKSQMRIHCLIETDKRFHIKSYIIMAGQEKNSEVLESCISSLFNEVNRFQNHLSGVLSTLTPLVISKCDWSFGSSPIKALKQSFITEIGKRISNEFKDQDLFMSCLEKCFQRDACEEDEGERSKSVDEGSGLLHQIKCQIRLRNREIFSSDIDKIMELKSCILSHQIVVVTGPSCSGKTSAIDILVQALNTVVNPGHTPRFDMKSRGNIDVLKSLSNERKSLSQSDYLYGRETNRKIILKRITLSNFTREELKGQRWINGIEKPSVLSSIFDPLLKIQKLEKFRLWLCVETDWRNINDDISIVRSCLGEDVKVIIEVTESVDHGAKISPVHGIVQFPRIGNINVLIIEQYINSLLSEKVISYYGCKYLKEITLNMFSKLFDVLRFHIEISQEYELEINWISQSLDILEVLLLENKDLSQEFESISFLEKRLNTYLSFSIVQGARGVPYSVLVHKRLVSHEDYERMIREILVLICPDVDPKKDELVSSLFGLMIDFDEMCLKQFNAIKGKQLPLFGSCADGVARFLIQLLVKHNRPLHLHGPRDRIDSFTDSIRYNKRIKLDSCLEFSMMRKSLYNRTEKYWDILSNKDPLSNVCDNKDIILLDDFSTDLDTSEQCISMLRFSIEYKSLYDSTLEDSCYEELSLGDFLVVLTRSHESNEPNYTPGKWTRWFTCINFINPHLIEVPQILYKALYPWICQLPKLDKELYKILAKKLAAFIPDVCLAVENENRTYLILKICDSNLATTYPLQQNWSRIIQISKSLISLPLDMFVSTFRKFEKLLPFEFESHSANQPKDMNERFKAYKIRASKVRVMRYLIFTVSRFLLDPLEHDIQRNRVISVINNQLDNHFFTDLPFEVDQILFKSFPILVENLNDIVMLSSRICEEAPEDESPYYQPIFEPHSWKIFDLAKTNISKIDVVKVHLQRSTHLKSFVGTGEFVKDLMKIYKHFCQYSLSNSALFVKSYSSLVNGYDWGVFISGLIQAVHIPLNASGSHSLPRFYQSLQSAMHKAGKEHQKVVFHIDSNIINITRDILSVLTKLIQQDSLVAIQQFLYDNKRSLSSIKTDREIRLTRVFLENIRRNLKILITVDSKDLEYNKDIKKVSEWFLTSSRNYLVLGDQNVQSYKDSLDNMVPILSTSHSTELQMLAEAHIYLNKYLYRILQRFGVAFDCNGKYLDFSMAVFNHLFEVFRVKTESKIQRVESAMKSVKNAESKIEKLSSKLESLQKELASLNVDISNSASHMKQMKESYGLALNQCISQEKLIKELTGPLNELKEKSKSNLNEVSPTYLAALETIRNLDPGAIEEIKTYIKPPEPVRDLVEIVFLLLGYDNSWEEIKEIMVKINLYEELLYFDKDHIDEKKYKVLTKVLTNETLHQESLMNVSQAAASLSGWLYAILRYTNLSREINPQLGELLAVQEKVSIAQSELGKMKVRTDLMRQDLEVKVYEHKELLAKRKSMSDQIRDFKYKIDSGKNMLSDIGTYVKDWTDQRTQFRQLMQDLPRSILSFIISNMYLSRFPLAMRNEVLGDIQERFAQAIKEVARLTVFEDGDLENMIEWHQWDSLIRLHLDNASAFALILSCPSISFPDFGSLFLIHYQADESGNLAEILKLVFESKSISEIRVKEHEDHCEESKEFVHYIDCSRTDEEDLEEKLSHLMRTNAILLVDNIEMLRHLCPTLHLLLYSSGNGSFDDTNPQFRLVLLTRIMNSPSDLHCSLFTSSKLFHYEFGLTRHNVQHILSDFTVKICQPALFENLLQLDKQIFEIRQMCKLEKKFHILILTAIINVFDSVLGPGELVKGVIGFCIDSIIGDLRNQGLIHEKDEDFIKRAMLCQDPDQFIMDNSKNSVDFIQQWTNDKISKDTLCLCLLIEINLSALTGLSKIFRDNADLWNEYLKLPFMSSSRIPGFSIANQPDMLHKAVIWRLLNPSSVNDIFSSLIAQIFGQNILAFSINRAEKLKTFIEKSTFLRPLVLFTVPGSPDCLFNPLELIENHYKETGSTAKKLLLDCTSKSDLTLFERANGTDEIPRIYDHIVEPCWIILLNAHLYTGGKCSDEHCLLNFCNRVLKGLLKGVNARSGSEIHPECKLFVICENPEDGVIPGILLEKTKLFCCRASTNLDWKEKNNKEVQLTNYNRLTKAIFNVYHGMFERNSFRNLTIRNNRDLELIVELSSGIRPSLSHAIDVFNVIFYNKILQDPMRDTISKVWEDVSKDINDYFDNNISDMGLVERVDVSFIRQMSILKPEGDKFSLNPINNNMLIDQNLIDEYKCRIISICERLKQIINCESSVSCVTNQIFVKKLAGSIYRNLHRLPIWSIRILSNIKFDSKLPANGIDTIADQYFTSSNKVPNRKIIIEQLISISDWLDSVENLSIEMSRIVVDPAEKLVETLEERANDPLFVNTFRLIDIKYN